MDITNIWIQEQIITEGVVSKKAVILAIEELLGIVRAIGTLNKLGRKNGHPFDKSVDSYRSYCSTNTNGNLDAI